MSFSSTESFPTYIHIFHLNFSSLQSLLKDSTHLCIFLNKLSFNVSSQPTRISPNKYYEINNQFHFHFDSNMDLYLTIFNLIETDYFFNINWKLTFSETFPFLYQTSSSSHYHLLLSLSLHNLHNDNTLFVVNFNGYNLQSLFTYLYNNNIKFDKVIQHYYKFITKYIQTNMNIQSQKETKLINAHFDMTKEYFLHTKICTSLMGEVISYTEEFIKKGSVAIYKNAQNVKCIIQVRKINIMNDSLKIKFYIYEGSTSSQPQRELKVELYSVNLNNTFVILTHYFFKKVSKNVIDDIALGKQKLLRKLCHIIEKTFKTKCSINTMNKKS